MTAENGSSDIRAELLALYDAAVAAAHPDICLPAHLPHQPQGWAALCRRRRQGGGRHGRRGGGALSPPRRPRPRYRLHHGPARHARGPHRHAPERHRDRFGTASDAGRGKRRGSRADARPRGDGGRARSCPGPALGRRLGTVGRARGRPHARRQDRADARAPQVRRRHPRDEHGAPPRLAHQGRAPAQGHGCADAHARHLRRAGRRPRHHRLRPHRSRSHDACRRARRARSATAGHGGIGPDGAIGRRRGAGRSRQRDAQARRSRLSSAEYRIIATPAAALAAAAALARRRGYEVIDLGDAVTGEAREVAKAHAKLAREARAAGRRAAILSGGELSVTVRNAQGRGGRNQEYALALLLALARGPTASRRWPPIPTASMAAPAK